jgi:excinuclease ABC subunit A
MTERKVSPAIRLHGVRHHNLKNFDLELPLGRLIVITGLSGSGKSSLAFDTLFAEGQRRYIETFSPYARQFFDRMDKPQVDRIEGIPPAIAIEQRNTVKTTRSTVGTMTELCDYLKLLWPHLARLYCRQCGQPVRKETPQRIWEEVLAQACGSPGRLALPVRGGEAEPEQPSGQEALLTFNLPLSDKLGLAESLALVAKQGYQRLLIGIEVVRLEEALPTLERQPPAALVVVQDRLKISPGSRARFVEACEQAYHFGKGKLGLHWVNGAGTPLERPRFYSRHFHCAACDLDYREPVPALFSFNHPIGACPACRGFGRTINIDYQRAIPDRSKTLAGGAVKPWQSGQSAECQTDLLRMCRHYAIPTGVPFEQLPQKWRDWIIDGDPEYGKDAEHEWPRAWYGVKGYFRWLESRAYKMHVRVLLSRYRRYSTCPACHGRRFQPESLLFQVPDARGRRLTLADFYQLPIEEALGFVEHAARDHAPKAGDPIGLALEEARARLAFLVEVGLGYLTLDRPTRSLSGGETERVNLTTCLGTRLVNTLYVLDEPSVGLHPRDTARLVQVLRQLRDLGNTVIVVEHEARVIRAADQVVDLGPGHGESGGRVVFQGGYEQLLQSAESLTGQYLSRRKLIEIPPRRPVRRGAPMLSLIGARRYNLDGLSVEIPVNRFVCLTGVSGSGKTTLAREVLLPLLEERLRSGGDRAHGHSEAENQTEDEPGNGEPAIDPCESIGTRTLPDGRGSAHEPHRSQPTEPRPSGSVTASEPANTSAKIDNSGAHSAGTLKGWEPFGRVVMVDQSPLGKTPRSNPVVYIGAFEDVRALFAQSEPARQRGLSASAFSFNSAQGQCERCRGAGFEKIEMQFLSDVFIRCPDCQGRRYRPHILEVKLNASIPESTVPFPPGRASRPGEPPRRPGLPGGAARSESSPYPPGQKRPAVVHWSIADLLEATVDEAILFLMSFADLACGRRACQSLKLLQEVGLGYLRLGQPINTLSGGESQRLKLVSHLAEFAQAQGAGVKPTFFLFDEPTTGLHFEDIRVLLKVFQRLVEGGHSVLVIEHNLEVIKSADWVLDLGPEAGAKGGRLVAQGPPEAIAACPSSHTGQALKEVLERMV